MGSLQVAPPTRRDLTSGTWTPHLRSRSASRFSPLSVSGCHFFYYLMLTTNVHKSRHNERRSGSQRLRTSNETIHFSGGHFEKDGTMVDLQKLVCYARDNSSMSPYGSVLTVLLLSIRAGRKHKYRLIIDESISFGKWA